MASCDYHLTLVPDQLCSL